MKKYEYKCVLGPMVVNTGKYGKDSHDGLANHFEGIINQEASDGWVLDSFQVVSSAQKQGCFGAILSQQGKDVSTRFQMIIFRKEV